ncbi:MAG: hypothetical protein K2N66_07175, partial [Paramuribaculum sp.]|nr:hypothetical protein [Paramuribaculum sp.]
GCNHLLIGRLQPEISSYVNGGLVLYSCLGRDNFRHHISQLGFVGQQLVNKLVIPLTYYVVTNLIINI